MLVIIDQKLTVLHPNNLFVLFMDVLVYLIIFSELLAIPLYIGYFSIMNRYENYYFDYLRDFFYLILMIDIILRFNVGFYKEG